jgi:glycosyltransferase involved in cell wall biosynthesis
MNNVVMPFANGCSSERTLSTIIILARNGGTAFPQYLLALSPLSASSTEIIVADSGTDDTWKFTHRFVFDNLRGLHFAAPRDSVSARNAGIQAARREVTLSIDADALVRADTVYRAIRAFQRRAGLVARIDSYGSLPGASTFLLQGKSHHYTHQTAWEEASTFWAASGSICRNVFRLIGGFDGSYRYLPVEDIELGYPLNRTDCPIRLRKTIQPTYLKQRSVLSFLQVEPFHQALPWTAQIWRDRHSLNDLNLACISRDSTVLIYGLVLVLFAGCNAPIAIVMVGFLIALLLGLNRQVYQSFYC